MVEHRHSTSGAVHSHTPGTSLPPWSTRIPAAIKEAEGDLRDLDCVHYNPGSPNAHIITAGELALAKEFYEFSAATQMLVNAIQEEPPDVIWPAALCRFTEKVES